MAKRTSGAKVVDQPLYARLVAAYRLRPGVHLPAAQAVGLDQKTAKKLWEGTHKNRGWPAIKDVLSGEHARREAAELAKLEASKEALRVSAHTDAAAEHLAELESRRRELRDEAAKLDDQTLRVLRSNTLQAIASQAAMLKATMPLSKRIADRIERGVDEDGNPVKDMTAMQFAQLTQRLASTNRFLALAAESIVNITLAHTSAGDRIPSPTPNGLPGPVITAEDIDAELERTRAAIERVRLLGFPVEAGDEMGSTRH